MRERDEVESESIDVEFQRSLWVFHSNHLQDVGYEGGGQDTSVDRLLHNEVFRFILLLLFEERRGVVRGVLGCGAHASLLL